MTKEFEIAMAEIANERQRQDAKWGQQDHHPILWNLILMEEAGEMAKALNEWHFRSEPFKNVREELVQTAAVCVAMLEAIERNKESYK